MYIEDTQWTLSKLSLKKIISYMWGDHMIPIPYKFREDHQIPIPYKVWGNHKCL